MRWRRAVQAVCLLMGLSGLGTAQAMSEAEAMKSPACLAARERLNALMAEDKPDIVRLRAARQRGARACFRTDADTPAPSRADRPVIALPQPAATTPPSASAPRSQTVTAPSAPQPPQVTRCDEGGCWDSEGRRLNRAGNRLIDPRGRLCTQQGPVLNCP